MFRLFGVERKAGGGGSRMSLEGLVDGAVVVSVVAHGEPHGSSIA